MRNRRKKEQPMSSILPGLLRDKKWETQLDLHSIFPKWQEVVDEETARYGVPQKIVRGTLWVEVENSIWLQQLQYKKVVLLDTINAFLKKSSIKDIRFTLPNEETKDRVKKQPLKFEPPPSEELQKFEEQAAFVEDDASREMLIRLWYLSKACKREKSD